MTSRISQYGLVLIVTSLQEAPRSMRRKLTQSRRRDGTVQSPTMLKCAKEEVKNVRVLSVLVERRSMHTCGVKTNVAEKVWCTAHYIEDISDPLPRDELIGLALGIASLWIPGER